MPHRKIRAVRRKVEGAKERSAEKKQQAAERRAELRKRAGADVRRVSDAIALRTAPVVDEARQSKREAALLARQLGAGRVRSGVSSARERIAGVDIGATDAGGGALEQLAMLEDGAFGEDDDLGLSIDEEILDIDGRVDIADEMNPDSIVDDLEEHF